MADFRQRIDELAQLMDEFHLGEARLESEGLSVAFRRRGSVKTTSAAVESSHEYEATDHAAPPSPVIEPVVHGTPVQSPMAGIYYAAPSPGSAPFVKEGDEVAQGQIIGLIEAMKVFNEIPSPVGGTVQKMVAEAGSIVQPGDTLMLLA